MSIYFKNIFLKVLVIVVLATILFSVTNQLRTDITKTKKVEDYVSTLRNQEKILDGEKISDINLITLKKCGGDSKCFIKFFEDYNASTTLEKSFSFLSLLMRDYPDFTPYCHQMTHGIGHSEFKKQGGNLDQALLEFSKGNFFKNLSTCGSGYYHGLVESAVKNISDKQDLTEFFKKTCNESVFKDIDKGDCLHGLGHAVITQTGSLNDSLSICDQTVSDDYNRFNCYTGIFMQIYIDMPYNLVITKESTNTGDKYSFPICDNLGTNDLAKRACYFEQSLAFTGYTEETFGSNKDYGQAIKLCQNISDQTLRLACVKNFSIRSFVDVGYTNINRMCLQNTKTKAERVYCVSAYAHRLALSITGGKRDQQYLDISLDICKNLSFSEISLCNKLILTKDPSLFLVSSKDLTI